MPILFAVSPFRAIRSAPVMTASTFRSAMSQAAVESVMSVAEMSSCWSSQAVRRAPWSSGRVSSTQHVQAGIAPVRGADDAERRPEPAGRERARVAVGQHLGSRAQEARAVLADPHAAIDLVGVDRLGPVPERLAQRGRVAMRPRRLLDHPL